MRRTKNKTGFSLVELLVAFAIIVIVFAAVVPQFRAIRNSWSGAEAGAAIIQNGRILAEHITRNLSAATEIISVSADSDIEGSIVFKDNDGNTKRYLFSGGYVVYGVVGSEEQLAGPVEKFQLSCFSLDDFENSTTDVNTIRLVQIETEFPNDSDMGSDKTFKSEVFIQANTQSSGEQSVIDIMVKSGEPDTPFDYQAGSGGCDAVIDIDNWDSGSNIHGLLYFKNVIGVGAEQIPLGTEITSATLKLWYVNHNGNANVYFYRMTELWDETSTWNSIGGGVNPGTNCDSGSLITANLGNSTSMTVEIDVTSIVQDWIDGEANYGFGIINTSNNNLQFAAAESTTGTGAHTPILEVVYTSADLDPGISIQNQIDYGGSNAVFDSYQSSEGSYGGDNVLQSAVIAVNATGSNKIVLYSNATVYGDAYIGPGGAPASGIKTWSGSVITGIQSALSQEMDFTIPTSPTGSPFNGSHEGNLEKWGSMSETINSDHYYNNLYLWDSSYIVIDGDVTILVNRNLELGNNASIRILPGSTLNLYVRRVCNIGGQLNAHYDKEPPDLKIYMLGNNKAFNMYGSAEVYAMLDNPRGGITNWNSRQFYGCVKGKTLEGNGGIHMDIDSSFSGSGSGGESQSWIFGGESISSGEILP